jgi:hypothetical protein
MGRKRKTPVETAAEHHQRISEEAQHLLEGGRWPDEIARTLGYASAGNLSTCLKKWGYVTLGERFDRINFDGLVAASHLTTYERRRGAAV